MSESPLPDDPAQWPQDPNELLGVSFGVSPRELRRAYNRLIRIYKPEQFPEQFRRIREAYEYLLRFAEMFASHTEASESPPAEETLTLPVPKEPAPDAETAKWIAENPQPLEQAAEGDNAALVHRPEEELEELWQQAIAGRPTAAYERLAQLTQQYAGRVEFYQRLYWLLTLWPDLDRHRVPADWLAQGLLATGMAGPLRELYREVIADDPAEALSERYERLLESPIAAGLLVDLFEWRLRSAVRLRRWDILDKALPTLHQRFDLIEEELWLRLVFALADNVAWAPDAEGVRRLLVYRDRVSQSGDRREWWTNHVRLLASCREEIARHEHLASSMSHFFDRFDLLVEASTGWLKLCCQSRIPVPMLQLLGTSWSRPFSEVRDLLMTVLELMAAIPPRWLDHLDEMRELAPATLALFGEVLDRFEESREMMSVEPREPELLKGLVLSFLPQLNVAGYEGERSDLLMFCIREDIAPEEMAEVASGFTAGWEELGTNWARLLMKDWSLRHIYRACRLFWA